MDLAAQSHLDWLPKERRIRAMEEELRYLDTRKRLLLEQLAELRSHSHVTYPPSVPAVAPSTPNEKAALFLALFRARESVYPRLWENPASGKKGYAPVCRNEWVRGVCEKPRIKCSECPHQNFPALDESAVIAHLTGRHTIGTYAIREDNTCTFLAADFDGEGWEADVAAYREAAAALGVEAGIERSRSGQGAHAWIFFTSPVAASLARRLGTLITAKASCSYPGIKLSTYDRFFPNQDMLPEGGFGNLIALPLQRRPREHGNTVFLDQALSPIPDQWRYLSEVRKVSPGELRSLLECIGPLIDEGSCDHPPDSFSLRYDEKALDVIPASVPDGVFNGIVTARRTAHFEVKTESLPACLIASLRRLATFANPIFYEKQRLRFPTYNTPRFLFCGATQPGHLILPRGTLAQIRSLLHKAGGTLAMADERPPPNAAPFSFTGKLTEAQRVAVNALLEHEDGVLVAPPGSGKTVIACAAIAARAVSTLILVHRRPLLEQWRAQLQAFLGLEKSAIHILQSSRNAGAPLALGMLQTVARADSAAALFAN